jgi:hypothetical protein
MIVISKLMKAYGGIIMKISLKLVLTVLVTVLSLLLEATQKEDA